MTYVEALNKDKQDAEKCKNRPVGFGAYHFKHDLDEGVFHVERRKLGKFVEVEDEVHYEEYFYNDYSKRIEKNVLTKEEWDKATDGFLFDDHWLPVAQGVYNNAPGCHQTSKEISNLYKTMLASLKAYDSDVQPA